MKYIDDISGHINMEKEPVTLSNEILEFIINLQLNICREKGIKPIVRIEDFKETINAFDLCTLMNNLIDNAIEAAENTEQKVIYIEADTRAGYQRYSIKNSIEGSVLAHNEGLLTSKEDYTNHGLGMKQIYDVIHKYEGHLDIYEVNNLFCVNVFLPKQSYISS